MTALGIACSIHSSGLALDYFRPFSYGTLLYKHTVNTSASYAADEKVAFEARLNGLRKCWRSTVGRCLCLTSRGQRLLRWLDLYSGSDTPWILTVTRGRPRIGLSIGRYGNFTYTLPNPPASQIYTVRRGHAVRRNIQRRDQWRPGLDQLRHLCIGRWEKSWDIPGLSGHGRCQWSHRDHSPLSRTMRSRWVRVLRWSITRPEGKRDGQ